jgi:hypothetical protein
VRFWGCRLKAITQLAHHEMTSLILASIIV